MTKDPSLLLKLLKTVPEIHKYIKDSETKLMTKERGQPIRNFTKIAGLAWAAIGDAAISFDPLSSQGILQCIGNVNATGKSIKRRNLFKKM